MKHPLNALNQNKASGAFQTQHSEFQIKRVNQINNPNTIKVIRISLVNAVQNATDT